VVINNELKDNGLPGVALHNHAVAPISTTYSMGKSAWITSALAQSTLGKTGGDVPAALVGKNA
jgi:hypothetical protein